MSKRNFLTLEKRVEVIRLSESGKSGRAIAEQVGVGRTQIHGILKRKREIMDEFENNVNMEYKRPRRATTYEDINDLCLKWFNDATGRRINVSGPLLKERALKYAQDLGVNDFKASNGWLESFLKRNNIVFKTMSGERGDVDKTVVQDWKDKLPSLCEGYEPENIFNMDETGLFYRDSTKSTYFKKGEDCSGGKRSKERLTVALCASMTGNDFFGKRSNRWLSGSRKTNKKAWMTGEIFEEWLHWFDRQMKGRKVLLFVDNAPSHPQVNLKNVNVKFLPPNTTSLCQPMDQGIIQAMKLKYRKKQLQYVISQMELKQGKSGFDLLKDISVLDAIYWVARAFKEVEISTIVKCFAKCGFQLNSV
ncbi:tigger transposable element-derived protein 4-like [Mercenaria mercenaria]|uniref:tigger transposable element-derived protein 4-like n=1 Tax=Mercenaria mercenaria TaxID=6596 RepID=UPI00234F4B92|nr:tigger transposable element-derived protein 4-like [Mercenaria mercenaria]